MHRELAREFFQMQLQELIADTRYLVTPISDMEALVRVQAGSFLPVFRIKADESGLEAPLIEFADPYTSERLPDEKWPQVSGIASGNTLYPGKIICRPGNIAYHTHQSHLNNPFDRIRNHFTLKTFFDRFATKFEVANFNMDNTGGIYNG